MEELWEKTVVSEKLDDKRGLHCGLLVAKGGRILSRCRGTHETHEFSQRL